MFSPETLTSQSAAFRIMPRKKQLSTRKKPIRYKSPPPESIIRIEDYTDTPIPGLDESIVSTVETFTKLLFEPSDEPDYEIKSLLDHALTGKSSEECSSVGELHSLAVQCIKALDILAEKRPDLLRPIASKKTVWPTLYSNSPLHKPAFDKRLETIGFATEAGMTWIKVSDVSKNLSEPFFQSAKGLALLLINSIHTFRTASISAARVLKMFEKFFQTPADEDPAFHEFRQKVLQCAVQVIAFNHIIALPWFTMALIDDCVRLPKYSSEESVTDAWWNVGYQLLMLNFHGHPEFAPPLYEMGRSREKHYSGLKVTWTEEYYKPEAVKSNVRAKLLTDLREEFGRLARQLAKTESVDSVSKKDKIF